MRGPLREADIGNFQVFAMTAINNVDMEGVSWTTVSPPDHLKKDEYRSICFFSLTSQHCEVAACNGRSELTGKKDYFLLLQEPSLTGGKVAEFGDLNPMFAQGTDQELQ